MPGGERYISQKQTQITFNKVISQAPENESCKQKESNQEEHFMAYTPELSQQSSCALRRIAWALEIPMTKTMERIFEHISMIVDTNKVCGKCRDKTKCNICLFNTNN